MTPEQLWAGVGIASVAGILWERAFWWHERQQAKIAACPGHRWIYHSLHDNGEFWNKKCERCPAFESRPDPPTKGDRVRVGKEIIRL